MSNPFSAVAQFLGDSLANLVTGMGTAGDKTTATRFIYNEMSAAEALDAYRGDWLSRRIIDTPANDQTREWRAWQASKDEVEALEAEERRLNVVTVVNSARKMARVYGGAGVIIGVEGETDPSQELDPETIRKNGLAYLLALPRHKLTAGQTIWTPGPDYGLPASYTMSRGEGQEPVEVHRSRVIRFVGAPVFSTEAAELSGWGDPVLASIRDAVIAAGTTIQEIAAHIHEAKIDVLGIPRLSEKVSTQEDKNRLLNRTAIAQISKSNHGVFLKDAAETWEQKQISFSQMPELIDRYLQIASGAADIPATRLLGQSPAGMNSTGESDLVNYYDRVGAEQRNELQPALSPLDECLIRSALGVRPPEVHYVWRPLWQLSAKDKATVDKQKAETTKIYKDTGLIPDSALATAAVNQLVEDTVYPGLEDAMEEAKRAGDLPGYEDPEPEPGETGLGGGLPTGDPRQPIAAEPLQRAANDARTAPLYVSRPLINTADLIQWAKEQGFKTTIPAEELHVTVAHSSRPLDWETIPPLTDGLTAKVDDERTWWRWVARLGDKGAVVLMFDSPALKARWQEFNDAGASWDYESYMPHVTISYDAGDYLDIGAVTAYLGPLEFGPERYEPVREGSFVPPREVSTEGGTD